MTGIYEVTVTSMVKNVRNSNIESLPLSTQAGALRGACSLHFCAILSFLLDNNK